MAKLGFTPILTPGSYYYCYSYYYIFCSNYSYLATSTSTLFGREIAVGRVVTLAEIVKHVIAEGTGFQPKGKESQVHAFLVYVIKGPISLLQIYSIDGHDLCLIGTSEIPLAGLHLFTAP